MPKISKYNGGYVIISLNDEDIYEKIERNLYKPILLTDIVINGIEKNDVFTTAYVEGTNIVFKDIYDKDITISNDNSVSIGDNDKHLYRYIFWYSDWAIELLCNKPFSRLNTEIVAIKNGNTTELTPIECQEIINNLQSNISSKYTPALYSSFSTSTPSVNNNNEKIELIINNKDDVTIMECFIKSDGSVVMDTGVELLFKCVKIF